MKYSVVKRGLLIFFSVVGIVGAIFIADYLVQLQKSEGLVPPGTETQIGGPFSLVDHNGRAVTERNFASRHKLIFFGFINCPEVCPTALIKISAILQRIGPLADHIYPLFITVDPERDTPEQLRQYANAFDSRIIYLTGSPAEIERVTAAWRVTRTKYAIGKHDYSIDHTAALYLMSPDGKLLESYGWNQAQEDIEHSIRKYLEP